MNGRCLRCGKSKTVAGPQCLRCQRDFTPATPEQHQVVMRLLGEQEHTLLRISDRLDGAGFWAAAKAVTRDAEQLAKLAMALERAFDKRLWTEVDRAYVGMTEKDWQANRDEYKDGRA